MTSGINNSVYLLSIAGFFAIILSLIGLSYIWFCPKSPHDLPYLGWLLTIGVGSIVTTLSIYFRKILRYAPHVEFHENTTITNTFLLDFIKKGTSITIYTNRGSWLINDNMIRNEIINIANRGSRIIIIATSIFANEISCHFSHKNISVFPRKSSGEPHIRFTLLNFGRTGSEKLAIARGIHPDHEVTVFDSYSGPHIISLAKEIISQETNTNE